MSNHIRLVPTDGQPDQPPPAGYYDTVSYHTGFTDGYRDALSRRNNPKPSTRYGRTYRYAYVDGYCAGQQEQLDAVLEAAIDAEQGTV